MKRLKQHIQAVMTGERHPGPLLGSLLMMLSMLYRIAVKVRGTLYDIGMLRIRTLPCRVISVGNLTVGGTGKTPMTIYLASLLSASGCRPVVISRGYKGGSEKTGEIVSDLNSVLSGPETAGDEPFMMARRLEGIPVLVGADRFAAGMKAMARFSPDVVILDDGFQHRRLKRDLDIVLVDDKSFLGNGYLLPRGVLREPVSGISRADLLVLTRCHDHATDNLRSLTEMAPRKPVLKAFHEAYVAGIFKGIGKGHVSAVADAEGLQHSALLEKAKVFVFSGIARNDEFQQTVAELVGEVTGSIGYNDHHNYTQSDFRAIIRRAKKNMSAFLVTTEKDYVKIAGNIHSPMDIVVIGIRISFRGDEAMFADFIKEKIFN